MSATNPTGLSPLVDTHCHVDLFRDPAALLRSIERRKVYTVAVTNTPSVFPKLCELVADARFIRPALGLHPEVAAERHVELAQFCRLLPQTKYVGEVGLDYQTTVNGERALQRRVFTTIIEQCDAVGGKVVTVHSRRAADDVVTALGGNFRGTYILHWFSGSRRVLRRAIANGAYFSFNPAMMRSAQGRARAAEVPQDRVLTETDGPFVTVDGQAAEPHQVEAVTEALAEVWGTTPDEARRTVYQNFVTLLQDK